MKIHIKMYNRETKDCEMFVRFNESEYEIVKDKGFIREEYFCCTSIKSMNVFNRHSGGIRVGVKDSDIEFIPFNYEYCKWNNEEGCMEYNVIDCSCKRFVYGDDLSCDVVQKRFIWDLIMNDILKFD